MNSEFTVNLEQLDRIVSRLSGLSGFVRDHLDELDRRVAALHSGSWESAAATAYAEAHREWVSAAGEFAEGVAAMSDVAARAHGRYSRAVEVNRRMLQSGQA
ncbi:WXG100 family type VII secretion target [Nocardia sp. NPDC004068]|uniref:WXG100 family type VII secretion target n=1 Tax=Nocardia sp. NPDC004068 TaxID=3364303 RepID=UPI0036736A34